MSARLLVAVTSTQEAAFVTTVGASRELTVARRCADIPDLLAAADAGVGTHAVVSPDVPHLERGVIDRLHRLGTAILGVVAAGDESGERRLRQLGVTHLVAVDAPVTDIERAVAAAGAAVASSAAAREHDGPIVPDVKAGEVTVAGPDAAGLDVAGLDVAGLDVDGLDVDGADARLDAALAGDLSALRARRDVGMSGEVDHGQPEANGVAAGPRRGELLAVWGPIGSPGRTTVAVNLAAEFAGQGVETLLIDADTYAAAVAQVLGLLEDTPGRATAARAAENGSLDAPGLARRAPEVSAKLRVLTGLPRADRWPEVRDAAMENILENARLIADVIVVDCGFSIESDEELSYDTMAPRRNAMTLTTLAAADQLVVVGSGDPVGLQRLVRAVADLGQVPSPPPSVVVNRVRRSAAGPRPAAVIRDVLGRCSGIGDVTVIPDDRDACDAATLAGRTLVENAPDSPARLAIADLARELIPDRMTAPPTRRRRFRR